jgi:Flp pilus assembly protein TadD
VRIDPEAPWLKRIGEDFLVGIMEEALRRDPDDLEALEALAHAYTRDGRVAEGLALDLRLAALLPEEPGVRYNLACSLALAGRADEAFAELGRAVDLGYRDAAHAAADADLASLRPDPRFRAFLERMGG